MVKNDYLTNIKTYIYDLQDLINEVLELRAENKSLRELIEQYEDFTNRIIKRQNDMSGIIVKHLINGDIKITKEADDVD